MHEIFHMPRLEDFGSQEHARRNRAKGDEVAQNAVAELRGQVEVFPARRPVAGSRLK